jgi:hypothetical protein
MIQDTKDSRFYKVDITKIPFYEDSVSGSVKLIQSIRIKNKYFNSK